MEISGCHYSHYDLGVRSRSLIRVHFRWVEAAFFMEQKPSVQRSELMARLEYLTRIDSLYIRISCSSPPQID